MIPNVSKRINVFLTVLLSLCFAVTAFAADDLKTSIVGGSMEIIKGGKQVVFTEGAKVTRGANTLTAEKIVQDKKNNYLEAYGNVNFSGFSNNGERMFMKSGKALYNMSLDTAEMSQGRPEITYYMKESTGPLFVQADNIKLNQKKEEILAVGDVLIISSSATARSPQALFLQKSRIVVLSGKKQSSIIYTEKGKKDKSQYKADKITFLLNEKKTLLDGNVTGRIITSKKEKGKK